MKRLSPTLLNVLTGLSLLLFLATIAMWAGRFSAVTGGKWPWLVWFIDDGVYFADAPSHYSEWRWWVPYWKLAVLALVLPAMWVRSAWRTGQRRRRTHLGFCDQCGY